MLPLSALGLVARHGIGILHLQRVEVVVGTHLLQPVGFQGYILVVGHHAVEELLVLLAGQRWSLGGEGVEQHGGLQFHVIVVGEPEPDLGKPESVQFMHPAHPDHTGAVAVGDEPHRQFFLLRPVVIVFHHHKSVAGAQFLLMAQDGIAYAEVEDIGALVGPCDDDGAIVSYLVIARLKRLNEFIARHHHDIGEPREPHFRQFGGLLGHQHLPDAGGIEEDARLERLSEHLAELAHKGLQAIGGQPSAGECGRVILADGRQLCPVADEQEAAVSSAVDEAHQVVEQPSAAESAGCGARIGYHRGLVDHEERVVVEVVVEGELAQIGRHGLLPVYLAVYGEGLMAAVHGKHFGGPSGGRHQHHFLPEGGYGTHDGRCQHGLARARRAPQYHHRAVVAVGHEFGEGVHGRRLFGGGCEGKCFLLLEQPLLFYHDAIRME